MKSSNAHGIHSPFVYDLVTKCFYKKQKSKLGIEVPKGFRKKHLETLNEVLSYFKIKKANFLVDQTHFVNKLPNSRDLKLKSNELCELVYIDEHHFLEQEIEKAFKLIENQGVLIVESPYKNQSLWCKLKEHSNSQVVIDTYFFGFVFTHKTQARETFYIRL